MGFFKEQTAEKSPNKQLIYFLFLNILFIYSWETQREREAETQAEGEAGSTQGAWCGTQSLDPSVTPLKDAKLLGHPGVPQTTSLKLLLVSPLTPTN